MFSINLSSLILQTLALLLTAFLLPRFQIRGPISGFIMVLALAFVNSHVWDAALFYSIPNSWTVQTLVTFVVNGLLFWLLAKSLPGVEIRGIMPALIAPVLFTAVSIFTYDHGKDMNWHSLGMYVQETFKGVRGYVQRTVPQH